ncbi:MAG: FUSC family protein, partial [Beijerinckiaceae bacterium]|nr:FUSC family protein [Beijerinckiaceae bacterium]
LGEGVSEIRTWLKLERMAQTSSPADIVALEQAATSITPILLLVALIDRRGDAWPADLRDYLALVVREMAEILRAGGYPVEISLRDEAFSRDLTSDGAAILRELKETLVHFTELSPASVEAPTPPKAKGGFFAPDAFTNSDHVYFALKTTAAAMVCYITYTLLDWPGIHTCLITCYVASLATAAETIEKLTLRIVGCLAGAVAGLATMIWLIPDLTSIEALLTVIFIATVISGYIVAGGPRISYAGFQVGFAFFLCILQGAGPGFDMVTARDRIIGILFGILVMYLVFTAIRPTSVTRRVAAAVPTVLRRLREMTTAATGASRGAMSTDVNAALCEAVRDLEIAGYEPSSVRPPKDWLAIRRQALGEMAAVLGPLLLVANQNCAPLEAFASRFDRLADHLEHASGTDAPPDASDQEYAERAFPTGEPEAASDLNAMIDGHLARLESLFADVADPRSSMHAPA